MTGASEIVTGVISALLSVVLVLISMLKLYLPKLKSRGNPDGLAEIRQSLQKISEAVATHNQMAARDHQDVMAALMRIEARLG